LPQAARQDQLAKIGLGHRHRHQQLEHERRQSDQQGRKREIEQKVSADHLEGPTEHAADLEIAMRWNDRRHEFPARSRHIFPGAALPEPVTRWWLCHHHLLARVTGAVQ
jgi:hypothetical protein